MAAVGTAVTGTSVTMDMKDLIELMATEVARNVVDQLREEQITPLAGRVSELEKRQQGQWGAYEGIWKLGVILMALAEMYHYFVKP